MNNYCVVAFASGCIYMVVKYSLGCIRKNEEKNKDREKIFQMIMYSTFLAGNYMIYYVLSLICQQRIGYYSKITDIISLLIICKIVDWVYKMMFSGSKKGNINNYAYLEVCDKNWCNLIAVIDVSICGCMIKVFTGKAFGIDIGFTIGVAALTAYISISEIFEGKSIISKKNEICKIFPKINLKLIVISALIIAMFSMIVLFSINNSLEKILYPIMAGGIIGVIIVAIFALALNFLKGQCD